MQTLVIYDTTGKIYYQASGDVQEPAGIPYLWVEIPDGKYITGVDVSGDTPTVILGDIPVGEVSELKERMTALETALTAKMTENTELNLTALEAMAETYETVLPFLP